MFPYGSPDGPNPKRALPIPRLHPTPTGLGQRGPALQPLPPCHVRRQLRQVHHQVLTRFISFIRGLASGSLDTGGNVLLLNIWEGRDSGPYMHALHFTFGIGAFLAPLISRPFLVNVEEVEHLNDSLVSTNLTEAEEVVGREVEESLWTVKTLYPMVSAYPVLLSIVFIVFHVKDRKKVKQGAKKEEKEVENQLSKGFTIAIVVIVSLLFFLYVGMEV